MTQSTCFLVYRLTMQTGSQHSQTASKAVRQRRHYEAIVDLDLTPLSDIEPPRGYGRD